MIGIGELLSQSWEVFQRDWKKLCVVAALPMILTIAIGLIVGVTTIAMLFPLYSLKNTSLPSWGIGFGVMALILLIVIIYLSLWGRAALLLAVKKSINGESYGWKSVYKESRQLIGKLMGVWGWSTLIMFGAILLLVLPALIVFVWIIFADIVVINEGFSGLSAIKRSRNLVKGRWWQVFGRFLVIPGIAILAAIVLSPYSKLFILSRLVDFALNLVITIVMTIYMFLMYKNLIK